MHNTLRLDGAEILVVSPTPTWPLDHGNRKRVFSVCDALKQRGAIIHFVYYPSEGDWRNQYPKKALQVMHEQWDYVYKVTPSVPLHVSAKGDNHTIDEWWDEALERELNWLSSVNRFDAMIVNYSWLSKALECVPESCLKVLDTHDRFSNRGELLEEHGIQKEFFHTTRKEETKALVRANIVWAIKHEEAEFFHNLLDKYDYDAARKEAKEREETALRAKGIVFDTEEESEEKIYHIHTDVAVKTMLHVEAHEGFTFQAPYLKNNYLTVGIVGAYNNINLVNTKAFLDVALPIFEKYMVPVKILLAGSMCKGLQDVKHPFVEQLGRVESLDDFYSQLDIALVPMTFSTGLKIKAGEALAYGVPLMAHKHAFEGYPSYHPWQVLDSLEAIALAVTEAAHNYQEVENLRIASERSQTALRNEVSDTLDHFVETMKEKRKTAVIVLPELYAGDYSLVKLGIENVWKQMDTSYRVVFYYPYPFHEEVQAYLEKQSNTGMVVCEDKRFESGQILAGMALPHLHQIWEFDLLWNLSDKAIDKFEFEKTFFYFDDKSFDAAFHKSIDDGTDVAVYAAMPDRLEKHTCIDWYACPISGSAVEMYKALWHEKPAEESSAVYMLLSGTKEQIYLWYSLYTMMFEDTYELYWIIDSDEVDWPVKNRLDIDMVLKDYSQMKEPARCGIMANFGDSNRLAVIAWALYICKRRIYDVEEVSLDEGVLKLSSVYHEMKNSIEKLDLNNYNNRFQHNVATKAAFSDIVGKLKISRLQMPIKKEIR